MKALVTSSILAASLLFVTTSAFAAEWVLKSSKGGWDVTNESTHSSSSDCEKARKVYIKSNPDRQAVCIKK